MDKKGLGKAALWAIKIIMIVAIVAIVHILKTAALGNMLETYDTEFIILNNKILYSPTALAYTSLDTGRTYPGIISLDDFNEGTLNKSMTKNLPAKLTLIHMNRTVIKEIYHDRARYDLLIPLTFSQKYDLKNKTHYVLLNQGDELNPALLNVEVVVPR